LEQGKFIQLLYHYQSGFPCLSLKKQA